MRFGCCATLEGLEVTRDAGFDYAEMKVGVLEPEGAEATFAESHGRITYVGLPLEAFNVFIPGNLPVVGERVDRQRLDGYLDTALRRMHDVGASIVVFGSGGARSTPPGFDQNRAVDQIADFLNDVAEKLESTSMTLAIEPLYKTASDNINTVSDALKMARRVDHPQIKVLADLFHMTYEDDKPDVLLNANAHLWHIHVPVPRIDGMSPRPWDEIYVDFLNALRSTGYVARISIEDNGGRFKDYQTEARRSIAYLKENWAV